MSGADIITVAATLAVIAVVVTLLWLALSGNKDLWR